MKRNGKLLPPGSEKYAWFAIYENYDEEVIKLYADWILTLRTKVDLVIDLHAPVNHFLKKQRETIPDFTLSSDGVHMNENGHRILAAAILKAWGHGEISQPKQELLNLVTQKMVILRSAWLSHVGHKRPGVSPGLPIDEAISKAVELDQMIHSLLQ